MRYKKVLIAIPDGYKYIELTVPDGIEEMIMTKAIKDIQNGSTFSHMYLDEAVEHPQRRL
jgi:hypothetical protein